MWCWLFHQRQWRMIWAEGESCLVRCGKCHNEWFMPRMAAVINPRIQDARCTCPTDGLGPMCSVCSDSYEAAAASPRFFIDHGMIHDRVSGRHVTTQPDDEPWAGMTITETCALLNSLAG